MEYGEINLKEIVEREQNGGFALPNFQRVFVWDREQQRQLIASFLVSIPIGRLLLLDANPDTFATRKVGERAGFSSAAQSCSFLLDGQQRVSTLKSVFFDTFYDHETWEIAWEQIYPALRNRWSVRIKPNESEDDIFGWNKLELRELKKESPDEMASRIRYQIVKKKDAESPDWEHPAYGKWDSDASRKAASGYLVPLWALGWDDGPKSIHAKVLDRIAQDRSAQLREELTIDQAERLVSEYSEESASREEALRRGFIRLETQWTQHVATELKNMVLKSGLPTTKLDFEEVDRAISIFEHVNRGGTTLSVFDLVVARAALDASEEKSLRERVIQQLNDFQKSKNSPLLKGKYENRVPMPNLAKVQVFDKRESLSSKFKDQFLNVLSILAYENKGEELKVEHIKKKKILDLSSEDINSFTPDAVRGLSRAIVFMVFRCGIRKMSDISYLLMLVPLARIFEKDSEWKKIETLRKAEYWYWASLFSGTYRTNQNAVVVDDIKKLAAWINTDQENPFLARESRALNEPTYSDQDTLILKVLERDIPAAVKAGVLQYVLSREPRDFTPDPVRLAAWHCSGEDRDDGPVLIVENHHILPLGTIPELGKTTKEMEENKKKIADSPLNRTYVSKKANRSIAAKSPAEYFSQLDTGVIEDHFIPENLETFLPTGDEESDSYQDMFTARFKKIKAALDAELEELRS